MEKRISDKQLMGLVAVGIVLIMLLVALMSATVLGMRTVKGQLDRHQQAEQFDQDMRQMQKLGGLDNYLKYKDASKCNQ